MAPPRSQDESSSYSAEFNDFIAKLTAYHQKRGTHLDPEPRVGNRHVDLLQLFNTVVERGGYDKVSDEKLAWRKLGQDFNLGTNNLPALAFSLKSAYYKNLAAYEISTIHGKEPPPKEILEEVTAKGGNLLTRTVANYRPAGRRETGNLGLDQSGESGDDGTPVRDRHGSEEPPGSGGRVTRGLRQAPPQRVLFQPDPVPVRQSRHVPPAAPTQVLPRGASTSHNPSSNPENLSQAVATYEPRPQMPLTLRPVVTLANNPVDFARRQRALRDQALTGSAKPAPSQRMMLPGTGFDGPNIYVRCLLALKSGIAAEQDYALHHLVKISMERGDKYRFESFPGLAEALVDKVLEVGSLFYDVDWEVLYLDDGRPRGSYTLDGLEGTQDLLQKIAGLVKKDVDDNIHTAEFSDRLLQVNEAALTLRNMVMLEENAHYVSELHPLRDLLSIALNLPNLESVVELKHYALDIAEQITKYLHFDLDDPLYLSLLAQLDSQDRGAILTSLRAISRISMNLEENNRLEGVAAKTLQSILDWTLLEDEELAHACLDFLYQYTAVVPNVNFMIKEVHIGAMVNQLTRMLSHGAKRYTKDTVIRREFRRQAPSSIPSIPQDLLNQLLQLDEPDRSSQWLRCIFEEDKDESITQIALWQAYQSRFAPTVQESGRPLLPAADFIKNVSSTFAERAAAQVQPGPVQKFIIKGIRIRDVPVDLKGREYTKCQWNVTTESQGAVAVKECEEYCMGPEKLFNHILATHVGVPRTEDGKFSNESSNYKCSWGSCSKYSIPQLLKTSQFASHLKIHVGGDSWKNANGHTDGPPLKKAKTWMEPAVTQQVVWVTTATDERGDAAGVPLTAVLVLRNLARNLPKTEADEIALKEEGVGYVAKFFKPVEGELWEVFAHNRSLAPYLGDLLTSLSE